MGLAWGIKYITVSHIFKNAKTSLPANVKAPTTTFLQGNFSCGLNHKKEAACVYLGIFHTHRVHLPNYDSSVFGASG